MYGLRDVELASRSPPHRGPNRTAARRIRRGPRELLEGLQQKGGPAGGGKEFPPVLLRPVKRPAQPATTTDPLSGETGSGLGGGNRDRVDWDPCAACRSPRCCLPPRSLSGPLRCHRRVCRRPAQRSGNPPRSRRADPSSHTGGSGALRPPQPAGRRRDAELQGHRPLSRRGPPLLRRGAARRRMGGLGGARRAGRRGVAGTMGPGRPAAAGVGRTGRRRRSRPWRRRPHQSARPGTTRRPPGPLMGASPSAHSPVRSRARGERVAQDGTDRGDRAAGRRVMALLVVVLVVWSFP